MCSATGVPLPFHRIDRVSISVVDQHGRLPPFRTDARQAQPAHDLRDGLAGDDLAVVTEVGEDLRRILNASEAPWNQQICFSIHAWCTARGDGSHFSQA
jgi:hypothetical protein